MLVVLMDSIRILGAGPSGLSAAINLAKEGYKVRVFERAKRCGGRFMGDLQGLENWSSKTNVLSDLREMHIGANFDCDPFSKTTFTNGSKSVRLRFRKPFFYLVKRGTGTRSLDQGMLRQARKAGVKVELGRAAREDEADIVASGPQAKKIMAADKGIVFRTKMKDTAIALVNDQAAYKGYAYLLVTKGYGCICTVAFDNLGGISTYLKKTIEIFKGMMDLDIRNEHSAGGVGSISYQKHFEEDGRLYVGEAAGLQDALWGFGIRSAITSGYLAARSISEGKSYAKLVEQRFGRYLKAGMVNRYLWEKSSDDDYGMLLSQAKLVKDPHSLLLRLYNLMLPQLLLYPVALRHAKRNHPNAFKE